MDAQELQNPERVPTIWVKNLNKTVNKMNNTVSSMIDMKPKMDGLYRYLYQPGEQHGDQKQRATNLIWSKNTYRLGRIVQDPGNNVLYYLQDRPDWAFVREELMHVSEDTQVPPDCVNEWK